MNIKWFIWFSILARGDISLLTVAQHSVSVCRFSLLIEGAGTESSSQVVTLTAALLVLVQDQLLQPLLLVPAVQVGLHRHLDLLLLHLSGRTGNGTVHITTHPCRHSLSPHNSKRAPKILSFPKNPLNQYLGERGPTFTPPEWDEVRLFIAEKVDEDFPLQLRK